MRNYRILKSFLSLIWKINPIYYLYLLLVTISSSLETIVNLILPKLILDIVLLDGRREEILKILLIFTLAKYILGVINKSLSGKMKMEETVLRKQIVYEFSKKSIRLDYSNLEDSKALDLKERALFGVNNQGALVGLTETIKAILTGILTLTGIVVILFRFSIIYTLTISLFVLISILLNHKMQVRQRKLTEEIVPTNRKLGYYLNATIMDTNQKDYRLFNMNEMLSKKMDGFNKEVIIWYEDLYRLIGKMGILESTIFYTVKFISYTYTSLRALTNSFGSQIQLGDFVFYINTTDKFFTSFQEMGRSYSEFLQAINFLEPFYQFMNLEESRARFGSEKIGEFESIGFKNLSFTYPNSKKKILDNISFTINKGEKISLVGINNAGKTTIVKLICGFFTPDSGRILLNGKDIKHYDYNEYMGMIGPVFQDFMLFPFTIRENIEVDERNDKKLEYVLKKANIYEDIEKLDKGVDSHLEKSIYEDATDLSGGQKQKIAIGRALYKDSQFIILDEPTAALDPMAEAEVYEKFNDLVEDKTAIYISHRMSSSTFCDKILLLNGGRIEAFDSHKNLMKGNNTYRELFKAQARHFE